MQSEKIPRLLKIVEDNILFFLAYWKFYGRYECYGAGNGRATSLYTRLR